MKLTGHEAIEYLNMAEGDNMTQAEPRKDTLMDIAGRNAARQFNDQSMSDGRATRKERGWQKFLRKYNAQKGAK